MPPSPQSVLLSCLLLAAAPDGVSAQASVFDGGGFERILGSGGGNVAFTYRRTEVSRRGLGLDLAIGLFPAALGFRTVRLQVDAGFAAMQAIGPASLVLKAGVSSLMDLGLSTELIPGLQAGVAAIVPLERRCAFRLDLTRRQFFPDGEPVALWSLGVGLTVRSPGRQASGRRASRPTAPSPDQAGGSSPGGSWRLSWRSFCARFRSSSRQC